MSDAAKGRTPMAPRPYWNPYLAGALLGLALGHGQLGLLALQFFGHAVLVQHLLLEILHLLHEGLYALLGPCLDYLFALRYLLFEPELYLLLGGGHGLELVG